jgi:hypothetical protein
MTATLVKNPLRTSLSMLEGHDFSGPAPTGHSDQPLAYEFATWESGSPDEVPEVDGYFDHDTQVWVTPDGTISMGIYTKTRTGGSGCGDCVTDDACA